MEQKKLCLDQQNKGQAFLMSAEEVYLLDDYANSMGLDKATLMEVAGQAVAKEVRKWCEEHNAEEAKISLFLGLGNNAGDALVAARCLQGWGFDVECVQVLPQKEGQDQGHPLARPLLDRNLKLAQSVGIIPKSFGDFLRGREESEKLVSGSSVWVDGVFGIGFKQGNVTDPFKEYVRVWNGQKGVFKIAIDVPSGCVANQGTPTNLIEGTCLKVDLTLALDALKFCHLNAEPICGEVRVLSLGFHPSWRTKALKRRRFVYCKPVTGGVWKNFPPSGHKFSRGHCLVIGGSDGTEGAVELAALAAYRAGSGYVTATVAGPHHFNSPEIVRTDLYEDDLYEDTHLSSHKLAAFLSDRKVDNILIGVGWQKNLLTPEVMAVLSNFQHSHKDAHRSGCVIFDGGALHGLLKLISSEKWLPNKTLALPHPGEWLKLPLSQGNPLKSLHSLEHFAVGVLELNKLQVVFKDTHPLIFSGQDESLHILNFPSRRLARAGSGDVIAGATLGLLSEAGGLNCAFLRAYSAVWKAVESVSSERGEDSIIPTDYLHKIGLYV